MSTRSGRVRTSFIETSPSRNRKGLSPPRSPARNRKTSPATSKTSSPTRSIKKSPSRKSPNRKTPSKFPARKSPSRSTKDTKQITQVPPENIQKSPSKRPAIKPDISVRLEDLSSKLEIYRNTRSKRIEYSINDVTTTKNDFVTDDINGMDSISNYLSNLRYRRSTEDPVLRRSSRLKEFIDQFDNSDIKRSVSKTISESKSYTESFDKFSDGENSEKFIFDGKLKSATRKLATPTRNSVDLTNISNKFEFGGRFGSLILIILLPLIISAILISCEQSCSINLNLTEYNNFEKWFALKSFGFILAQYLIQALISVLPIFGTNSDKMDGTGAKYCFNALFSSIFSINSLIILDYLRVIDKNIILSEYLQLMIASYIFAVILSIYMYVKIEKTDDNELNLYGNTGFTLYDFFMGREIHGYIKNLNVKIWMSRFSNITSLILLLLIFSKGIHLEITENDLLNLDNYKEIVKNIHLKPTLLIFSTMQIIYILYFIIGECKIASTFFWQSEGVGYLQIVSSAIYPFYFTTISKFVSDSDFTLSTNKLVYASLLYMWGFVTMLLSNNIKHQFRTNPLQPGLANLNAMPTFHGKKLLVGNLWGLLRHPNYTGDILIHITLAIPGMLSQQWVSSLPALLTILVLINRAWRDHHRCKTRYGAAWHKYCKIVPSVFIPNMYCK